MPPIHMIGGIIASFVPPPFTKHVPYSLFQEILKHFLYSLAQYILDDRLPRLRPCRHVHLLTKKPKQAQPSPSRSLALDR